MLENTKELDALNLAISQRLLLAIQPMNVNLLSDEGATTAKY